MHSSQHHGIGRNSNKNSSRIQKSGGGKAETGPNGEKILIPKTTLKKIKDEETTRDVEPVLEEYIEAETTESNDEHDVHWFTKKLKSWVAPTLRDPGVTNLFGGTGALLVERVRYNAVGVGRKPSPATMVIHPYSAFRILWDGLMTIVTIWLPYSVLADCMGFCDIMFNFRTGT